MKVDASKETSAMPAKLLKLLLLISVLKASRWTIKQLMERFEVKKSSMYRYLETLEEAGFYLDKDSHDRYFIVTTEDNPDQSNFTIEEMTTLRNFIIADPDHPLRGSLLKKLSLHSELDTMPRMVLKAHLANLVGQLTDALRNKHQVVLKKYHSANSGTISDRLVEPIYFGDNYQSIRALDVNEMSCKSFKLDRIGEVNETHTPFAHADHHEKRPADIFGITGETTIWITLHFLTARAYLLLKEEFPLAVPYLKQEDNTYTFRGPVSSFNGVGRFVMGLLDEVEIKGPEEFSNYVRQKVGVGVRGG
ncbi:WYL domain-containing protein [Chryseolinea sp. H1M3-3]|uniref:helix-turn-helix transcriptional regulator n=1 Tax=Chryseolinea sp. H1M3-3 TaxID=3034144 RepID=UPI0023ED0D07|nr:WYL domain-containing protein [Chryseolinea sp. H1M3-3]